MENNMNKSWKRRNYLISPKFQIKWTLIITLAGGLTAALFSALLWFSINQQNILLKQAINTDDQLRDESQEVINLVLNMPNIPEADAKKYKRQYYEISEKYKTSKTAKGEVVSYNRRARYWVIAFVFVIGICLFVWGVFLTHRVAGPLFVIRQHLQRLQKDGVVNLRPIRKKDEFHDLYQDFCDTVTKILAEKKGSSRSDKVG